MRWIAPILCYTADEIWQAIPGTSDLPVFAEEWYALPDCSAKALPQDLVALLNEVKGELNKVLEQKRSDGQVGKSLEAEVTFYCGDELQNALGSIKDELRFVLLVSKVSFASKADASGVEGVEETSIDGLSILVNKTDTDKCERCWHHSDSVGSHAEHPTICTRCVTNVTTEGEERLYA